MIDLCILFSRKCGDQVPSDAVLLQHGPLRRGEAGQEWKAANSPGGKNKLALQLLKSSSYPRKRRIQKDSSKDNLNAFAVDWAGWRHHGASHRLLDPQHC